MADVKASYRRALDSAAGKGKMEKTMGEWKSGELHSGSKSGPVVKSRAQAVAIGISQAEKAAHRG